MSRFPCVLMVLMLAGSSIPLIEAQAQDARGIPCPEAARWLLERYMSADCEACWHVVPPRPKGAPADGNDVIALDWIVATAQSDEARMSAAALPEAAARVAKAGVLLTDEALVTSTPLPGRTQRMALDLRVTDGPAWNGYIGVGLNVRVTPDVLAPLGLVGFIAVTEAVPSGDGGSPVAREVVRTLIGPLSLDGLQQHEPVDHLRATRVPPTAHPERLRTVGWIETANGRVLSAARALPVNCPRPR